MRSTPYLSFQIHQVFGCSCRGYKVRWKWKGMGLDLGGVGGGMNTIKLQYMKFAKN